MALTDTEIRRSKPTSKPCKLSDSGGPALPGIKGRIIL